MTDNTNMEKRSDTLTDDEMDNVTGGIVNERESGSIPNSGGLSLDSVNTGKDIEELRKKNAPSNSFQQNCG